MTRQGERSSVESVSPSRLRWHDLLDEVATSLRNRPGRTLLTALGTILGIATLVSTVGLTDTASAQISARFDALEATKVTVRDNYPDTVAPAFLPDYLEALRQTPGVVAAGESWVIDEPLPVSMLDRVDPVRPPQVLTVASVDTNTLKAVDATVAQGRLFDPIHVARGEPVALLGGSAAVQLGIQELHAPIRIKVGPMHVTVIGILDGAPRRSEFMTSVLVVPSVAQQLLRTSTGDASAPPAHEVVVKVTPGAAQIIGQVAAQILRPQDPARLVVEVPPSPAHFRAGIQGDLRAIFIILGVVALAVGILGIANATLIAVLQRTREFGVRRALGARGRHIAQQVLAEACLIGFLGGWGGLAAGLMIVVGTAAARGWTPALDPIVLTLAPLLGVSAGALAGWYPAWKASKIEPVEALRL